MARAKRRLSPFWDYPLAHAGKKCAGQTVGAYALRSGRPDRPLARARRARRALALAGAAIAGAAAVRDNRLIALRLLAGVGLRARISPLYVGPSHFFTLWQCSYEQICWSPTDCGILATCVC